MTNVFHSIVLMIGWKAKRKSDGLDLKSDNLQYNTLGRMDAPLIDQASDGPSIILMD